VATVVGKVVGKFEPMERQRLGHPVSSVGR